MTTFRFSLVIAGAVALQGCSSKLGDQDLICDPSPGFIQDSAPTGDAQLAIAESCIHKWGYRLGRAPGTNDEIAKAVIGKCRKAIDRTLALKVNEGNAN